MYNEMATNISTALTQLEVLNSSLALLDELGAIEVTRERHLVTNTFSKKYGHRIKVKPHVQVTETRSYKAPSPREMVFSVIEKQCTKIASDLMKIHYPGLNLHYSVLNLPVVTLFRDQVLQSTCKIDAVFNENEFSKQALNVINEVFENECRFVKGYLDKLSSRSNATTDWVTLNIDLSKIHWQHFKRVSAVLEWFNSDNLITKTYKAWAAHRDTMSSKIDVARKAASVNEEYKRAVIAEHDKCIRRQLKMPTEVMTMYKQIEKDEMEIATLVEAFKTVTFLFEEQSVLVKNNKATLYLKTDYFESLLNSCHV